MNYLNQREHRSLKMEMTLDHPLSKTKCKSNLFSILDELNISDEKDIYSISYLISKEETLVHKIIIHFKSPQTGEIFYEYISLNYERYKYSNLIKNHVDMDESTFSAVGGNGTESPTDSIYVIDSTNSMSSIMDNRAFNMETSYYENDNFTRSILASKENINDLKESTYSNSKESLTHSTSTVLSNVSKESNSNLDSPDQTNIELHSNIQINEDDLDILIMFLENCKRSGGGNIVEFKLNDKQRVLTVKFEDKNVRDRVLDKKTLKFKNYTFNLKSPFNQKDVAMDTKTLVLRNFKEKIDPEVVQIYAENLVCNDNEENEILACENSKVFSGQTFYVKFKLDLDLDQVERNLKRKPTINGRRIELFKAYVTNSLIIRMADRNEKLNLELVDLHFTNKKRSGISGYEYLNEKEPFVILTLDSSQTVDKCLELKHEISKKELLVEYLYSFELVDEDVNLLTVNDQEEMDTTISMPVVSQHQSVSAFQQSVFGSQQSVSAYKPTECHKIETVKQEAFQVPDTIPSVLFDLSKETNACVLKYWGGQQMKRLTMELFEINAAMNGIKELDQIKCDYIAVDTLKRVQSKEEYEFKVTEWTNSVNQQLKTFFSQFLTVKIQAKHNAIISRIKSDPLRISVQKYNETELEIAGFKDQVNIFVQQIHAEIEKMQNEVVNKEINGLKLHECRILFVEKFIKTMKDKYDDMTVKINAKSGSVKMTGTRRQTDEAYEKAHAILKKIQTKLLRKSPLFLKLVSQKETAVANWLKERPIQCVLEADLTKNELIIYSVDQAYVERFIDEARFEIMEKEFDTCLIENRSKLNDLLLELEAQDDIVFTETDKGYLNFCGFKENVEKIYERLCHLT